MLSRTLTLWTILALILTNAAMAKDLQLNSAPRTVKPTAQPARHDMPADLLFPSGNLEVSNMNEASYGSFAADCNCCYKQGYMMMNRAATWIKNDGAGSSSECTATLSWTNGQPPYRQMEKRVKLPALAPNNQTNLIINFDPAVAFKTSEPVRLTVDSTNAVAESNEKNNRVDFIFQQHLEAYSYYFNECN